MESLIERCVEVAQNTWTLMKDKAARVVDYRFLPEIQSKIGCPYQGNLIAELERKTYKEVWKVVCSSESEIFGEKPEPLRSN